MAEKRNISKRYPKRLQLRFGQEGHLHMAFTEDISDTGLFIKTTRTYPPNTNLDIKLLTGDDKEVNIKGTVMWAKKVPVSIVHITKKAGMGIKIAQISAGEDVYKKLLI
ncbi:MAG: PilZ domain-containing protein [Deltaproteobacteria bacterium]|nr:PilZ domain-containing protein [Deltaproteobacteria bacterium]